MSPPPGEGGWTGRRRGVPGQSPTSVRRAFPGWQRGAVRDTLFSTANWCGSIISSRILGATPGATWYAGFVSCDAPAKVSGGHVCHEEPEPTCYHSTIVHAGCVVEVLARGAPPAPALCYPQQPAEESDAHERSGDGRGALRQRCYKEGFSQGVSAISPIAVEELCAQYQPFCVSMYFKTDYS